MDLKYFVYSSENVYKRPYLGSAVLHYRCEVTCEMLVDFPENKYGSVAHFYSYRSNS